MWDITYIANTVYSFNSFDYNLSITPLILRNFFGIIETNIYYILGGVYKLITETLLNFFYFIPIDITNLGYVTGEIGGWFLSCITLKIFLLNSIILKFVHLSFYKSQDIYIYKFIQYNLYKKIKEFLNIDSFTNIHWYYTICVSFTFYNIFSMLPKINNVITIIAIPTFAAFWIFTTQNFMGILVNKELWLFNFYPGKLLWYIAPLLICIEQIAYFTKPLSLSVRIFANMLAGHMLVHIISNYGSEFIVNWYFYLYFTVVILLTILNFLEYFICLVQPVIFLTLASVFFEDILTGSSNNDNKSLITKFSLI